MADQPDHSWRHTLKRRLLVAAALCAVWAVAIEARLVYLQVIEYDFLIRQANNQQQDTVTLPAKRGDILDRNGSVLAYNVDVDSVYADPREVDDPTATVAALCSVLRECSERDQFISRLKKLADARKKFAWLSRQISPEEARAVRKLDLKGVYLRLETKRYYPKREIAGHLLGFVGAENHGLAGLEKKFDELVGGTDGKALLQVDRNHRAFDRVEQSPIPGASLILTIDSRLQYIAERELAAGVQWSGAQTGTAIVMDPITGEILAAASYPAFNPNVFKVFEDEVKVNRAFQYTYEPGSTFKIVTMCAALEERLFTPTDTIDTNPGFIRFGARIIDEAKHHNYGSLTVEQVIVKSSNVGAVKIGLTIGSKRLAAYVERFGFGARTSRFFQGESSGLWTTVGLDNDSEVASVSMGYRVGVTPIQMTAAASAIANGGELLEPRVVSAYVKNGVKTVFPRKVVRRVVSTEVAAELTTMMEGVVEKGTATLAHIDGYKIAGKTGTAAKTLKTGRGYSERDFNVSFVGFVPSRNPVFTILVVIDSPTKVSAYGGSVAAPVFQKIASAALRLRGVPPSLNRAAPVLISRHDAVRQQPISTTADAVVTLAGATADSPAVLPNLVGMSAREATQTLVRLGVSPEMNGHGFVVSQRPAAGSALDTIASATLWLDRRTRPERPVADVPLSAHDGHVAPRSRP